MKTAPKRGIIVSEYLSMYHLPRICRTLVPEIHVHPEMLRVFRYIDMLTCVSYNCTRLKDLCSTEQQGRLELLVSAVKIINEGR